MNINIVETLTELRTKFGTTTELIFFQSDSIIQARIKIFDEKEKGFYNYAFNFSLKELSDASTNIFKLKFDHAVEEIENYINRI